MSAFIRRPSTSMQLNCFASTVFGYSSSLVPVTLPSQRETHFWYILPNEVQDASLLNRYLALLSPCEKENVFSMRGDNLQKRAILARTLVRTTIARYTNPQVNPKLLKFRKNVFGKPEVEWQRDGEWNLPPLHFNISHTSSLIACGVTVGMPIGIDVEEKQRKITNNIVTFARRYFSPYEVNVLHAISDPEYQQQEFIKIWTIKEAYVKALGRGFSAAPFKTFTIRFRATSKGGMLVSNNSNYETPEIFVEASDDPETLTSNWQFALFELASSHYAAICVEKENTEGKENGLMRLKVWKTLPFVGDECVSGTDAVMGISGLRD